MKEIAVNLNNNGAMRVTDTENNRMEMKWKNGENEITSISYNERSQQGKYEHMLYPRKK